MRRIASFEEIGTAVSNFLLSNAKELMECPSSRILQLANVISVCALLLQVLTFELCEQHLPSNVVTAASNPLCSLLMKKDIQWFRLGPLPVHLTHWLLKQRQLHAFNLEKVRFELKYSHYKMKFLTDSQGVDGEDWSIQQIGQSQHGIQLVMVLFFVLLLTKLVPVGKSKWCRS